ncbi:MULTISPECIES: tyrosine-type recombinase/integrase [Cyanophyceae]|nr:MULTISPECIES: tyrosine-type recombinase/integrase [unclassified Trichocoleus]
MQPNYLLYGNFPYNLFLNPNTSSIIMNSCLNLRKTSFLSAYLGIKEVLKQDLDLKVDAVRAKKSNYLPTVLTKDEVLAIIQKLSGVYQLLIKLLYGTGLRLSEGLNLRLKDVDFAQQQIIVRDTKEMKVE